MQEETSRKDDPTDRLVEYLRDTFAGEATPRKIDGIRAWPRRLPFLLSALPAPRATLSEDFPGLYCSVHEALPILFIEGGQ